MYGNVCAMSTGVRMRMYLPFSVISDKQHL